MVLGLVCYFLVVVRYRHEQIVESLHWNLTHLGLAAKFVGSECCCGTSNSAHWLQHFKSGLKLQRRGIVRTDLRGILLSLRSEYQVLVESGEGSAVYSFAFKLLPLVERRGRGEQFLRQQTMLEDVGVFECKVAGLHFYYPSSINLFWI